MMSIDARIDDVDAIVEIADGRVEMSDDITSDLVVKTPEELPLSARERHATLSVAHDDVQVSIGLDAEALAALADVLQEATHG